MTATRYRGRRAPFSADYWITGAPGFTDAGDPNAVKPAGDRIMRVPARLLAFNEQPNVGFTNSVSGVRIFLADGTDVTMRNWWYDDGQALWVPFGSAALTI